jgi:hypothetical protein
MNLHDELRKSTEVAERLADRELKHKFYAMAVSIRNAIHLLAFTVAVVGIIIAFK